MTGPEALFSRSPSYTLLGKCDEQLKVPVPESLKEHLSALAVLRGITLAEYVRDLLISHVHGHLAVLRMRQGDSRDHGTNED